MDKYICKVCATIYDPQRGDPESSVPEDTPFEDLPENWTCPICGAGKKNFVILPPEKYSTNIPKI